MIKNLCVIKNIRDLKNKKIHFIGIGGISMSAMAQILKSNKIYVQGSDLSESDEVKILRKKGITIFNNHSENNMSNIDVVVYTSAIKEDNTELRFAIEHNLIILKRAELLGLISKEYKNVIAIAGSHGKTTATAMISEIFVNAGLKPTIHIGGKNNLIKSNYKIGNKKYFITEACEYKDNYLYLKPDVAVILNIDSDHLDYFKTLDGVKNSFKNFANLTTDGGVVFSCLDDVNSDFLRYYDNNSTFGITSKKAEIKATKIKEFAPGRFSFNVIFCGYNLGKIKLNIFGKHNIYNALASILVGLTFDIDFSIIKYTLENFSGVSRRTEYIGQINSANVFHDYAHHPKQIEKMIEMGRELISNKGKLYVVFEPHTFSRTKYLIDDFALSLSKSDEIYLAPVYSAREDESEGSSSNELKNVIKKHNKNIQIFSDYFEILNTLNRFVMADDIVLILGAGTIEELARMINKPF